MPPEAYALVTLFLAGSILVGIVAVRLAARTLGGPGSRLAFVLPIATGFLAFYLVGHRFGLSVGPEIELFGFQVALLGDLVIGFAAALVAALAQALVVRGRGSRDRRTARSA